MKTIKIIIAALTIIITMSCETHYKMVTKLNPAGKARREIYAFGDSVFLSGNISKNSFLFDISSDWNIIRLDKPQKYDFFGDESEFNVIIIKDASSIEQFSKEAHYDKDKESFAVPQESLSKKVGLFYTHYSFKAVYKKLEYEVPVPIDNYLTKEEQIIWTQGNTNSYKTLNGCEMNDYLNKISDKFMEWYSRNHFEISLECIKKRTNKYDLDIEKENIYKQINTDKEITPEAVCLALDSFYKTDYFTKLYEVKEEILNKDFEDAISFKSIIGIVISYELEIPVRHERYKTVKTNAPTIDWKGTLIWKVDGIRLLFDDYTLTAEYKVVNKWALFLTGLVLIVAIVSIIVLIRKRS